MRTGRGQAKMRGELNLSAWLAHLYTASGAVLGFLAAREIIEGDYRTAFFWLLLQVIVDATDGVLARRVRVSERLPWFNGAKLDDIVDYVTYVFVPALMVWRGLLVPEAWALAVVSAMLLSSAYGFSREDAKTVDHFFTGFPSYWNIVALYLHASGLPAGVNGAILLALAALVFVRIGYVYPTRTPVLRGVTNLLCALWGLMVLAIIWMLPDVPPTLLIASLFFPVYYVVLSLTLNARRGRRL
jgi:phosphatidylcholine synthase